MHIKAWVIAVLIRNFSFENMAGYFHFKFFNASLNNSIMDSQSSLKAFKLKDYIKIT